MSLNKDALIAELLKLSEDPPKDKASAGQKWGEILSVYCKDMTPAVNSFDGPTASFKDTFLGIDYGTGDPILKLCFLNYAITLGNSMPDWLGTPPPILIDFTSLYALGIAGVPKEEFIQAMADIIDAWFRTGISTDSSANVVSWS